MSERRSILQIGLLFAGIAVVLGFLIPLASSFPDGLETVAEHLGVSGEVPWFSAPIPDYMIQIGNELLGTWLAGVIGMALIMGLFGVILLVVKHQKATPTKIASK